MLNSKMIPINPNIINLFKLLIRYSLILIGLVMFLGYIWLRFIRERLPKDIPFNLTFLGFVILVYLCCIYAYIVYILLSKSHSSNPLIKNLIDIIYKPLELLDEAIKNNPLILPYYKSFLDTFPVRFGYLFKEPYYFYYTFAILPRLILITVLFIDTFYFHTLHYIYKILLIGLFLLFNRYVKYSLKYAKEQLILEWESLFEAINVPHVIGVNPREIEEKINYSDASRDDYDDDRPPTMDLPLRIYVNFRSYAFVHQNYISDPSIYPTDKYCEIYCKKYDISKEDLYTDKDNKQYYKKYMEEKKADLERIMQIPLLLEYYNKADHFDPNIKKIKVLIFLNYLLCWLYILIVSLYKLCLATSMWYTTIEVQEVEYLVLLLMCIYILLLAILAIINLFRYYNETTYDSMKPLVEFCYNQLDSLDSYIKYYSEYTRDKHNYIINQIAKKMDKIKNYFILYLLANIVPRLIVIVVFIVEVFYYNHITLFYKLIPLLIIPMLVKYMYYSFKKLCDSIRKYSNYFYFRYEVDFMPRWIHEGFEEVCLKRFKGEQISDFKDKVLYIMYLAFIPNEKDTARCLEIMEILKSQLNDLIYVYQVIYLYNQQKIKYDSRVDITISLLYSICLLYIMLTCTVEPSLENFQIFQLLINKEEPFSGLFI